MDETAGAWAHSQFIGGHSEFILLTPIRPGRIVGERRTYEQRIRFVFETLMARTEMNLPTPLTTIPTIHFARWAILRPDHYLLKSHVRPDDSELELRSWLLTMVVFDGDARVYGREIAEGIEEELDRIFGNCEDYPGAQDADALWAWFRRYQLPTSVFHTAYPGLSVVRIRYLEDFKARFDAFVTHVRGPDGEPLGDMNLLFAEFLRESQQRAAGFPASGGTYVSRFFEVEEEDQK